MLNETDTEIHKRKSYDFKNIFAKAMAVKIKFWTTNTAM
jgi:hypothetical protein